MFYKVRTLMIAVAVIALGLALERVLFSAAVWAVTTHRRPVIFEEALLVWVFLNAAGALTLGSIVYAMFVLYAIRRRRREHRPAAATWLRDRADLTPPSGEERR